MGIKSLGSQNKGRGLEEEAIIFTHFGESQACVNVLTTSLNIGHFKTEKEDI